MGVVGLFAILFGIWFHWKMTEKQRRAKKEAKAREKARLAAAKRAREGDDDFEEEFLEHEDNSLPDDSDGEFKDTNLFGMKRKDRDQVFQDWD